MSVSRVGAAQLHQFVACAAEYCLLGGGDFDCVLPIEPLSPCVDKNAREGAVVSQYAMSANVFFVGVDAELLIASQFFTDEIMPYRLLTVPPLPFGQHHCLLTTYDTALHWGSAMQSCSHSPRLIPRTPLSSKSPPSMS